MTAAEKAILKSWGISAPRRRSGRPSARYVVIVRFEDGTEATRTTWTTIAEARKAATAGAALGSADLCRVGHEDVALECYSADGRVIK